MVYVFTVRLDAPTPTQQQQQLSPPLQQSAPTTAPFLNKMVWSAGMTKQETDLGMMPPPGTNMVPLSQRRPSATLMSDSNSPPMRQLKQEMIDENSQGSIIDPLELRTERFRHISESSMDVHPSDSNMSLINDSNSNVDILQANMNENSNVSIVNENSMEMMTRRNSLSRRVASENSPISSQLVVAVNSTLTPTNNSMAVNTSLPMNNGTAGVTSSLGIDNPLASLPVNPAINAALTVNTNLPISGAIPTNIPEDRNGLLRTGLLQPVTSANVNDLTVMDLRMKMPMATVADLANTKEPSFATLQSFGVMEPNAHPLPAQSGQSVENYLTNLEGKPIPNVANPQNNRVILKHEIITNGRENELFAAQKLLAGGNVRNPMEQVFVSTQLDNPVMNVVNKTEPVVINGEIQQTTVTAAVTQSITTEKLDALVNCAVEAHICSPSNSSTSSEHSPKDILMGVTATTPSEVMLTSQDVMLNSQPTLLPPMISTTLPSPTLVPSTAQQESPNLSTEVILNSQISPSLMCRNSNNNTLSQESLLPPTTLNNLSPTDRSIIQNPITLSQPLLTTCTNTIGTTSVPLTLQEPEKVIILSATVDFLETQNKIKELSSAANVINNLLNSSPTRNQSEVLNHSPISQLTDAGSNFVENEFNTATSTNNLQTTLIATNGSPTKIIDEDNKDFILPVPIKEITGQTQQEQQQQEQQQNNNDKKNENRMIPTVFDMSENELINIINPSCFDQGNNFH